MDVFVMLGAIVLFLMIDFIALRWGKDSRPAIDDDEWERRGRWAGFAGHL